MPIIKELSLKNFKSFRNAHVPLGKGYVTIVGPNGSGKSNLTDAIRFAFGENHLHALRARRVQDLIHQGSDKALIKLVIEGVGENGDGQAEIIRAIRIDGKTFYKFNGKRTTRSAIVDFLVANGLNIGEHNVIAQGEVEKIARLNSKERREIIDKVAGIAEFEEKRKEALSELGKVEQKLNDSSIVMKEREGVLAELEKEKDAALKYTALKEEQRRIKGTLVITQYKKVENEFTGLVNKCVELNKKITEANQELENYAARLHEFDEKRNELNAKIQSMDTQNTYAELAQLRGKIDVDENVLREKTSALEKLQSDLMGLSVEEEKIESKLSEFGTSKRTLTSRAAELKSRLEQIVASREKAAKEWEERRKKLGLFDKQLDEKSKEVETLRDEITRLKTQLEMSTPSGDGEKGSLEEKIKQLDAEISKMKNAREKLFDKEKELNQRVKTLDSEILKLNEEIAVHRGNARSIVPQALTFINNLRANGEIQGVYGTVGELFKVDKKYEIAAETAAGQRLNYVVVDNISTATELVKLLKNKNMGRATFIPLDVHIQKVEKKVEKNDKTDVSGKGDGKGVIGKVIDVVEYDSRFDNVFQYVFGDTLLVENVDVFKSVKTRAVTLDGDLYESSGIITGGSAIRRSLRESVNLSKLERELDVKKKERETVIAQLYSINEEITLSRRAIAEKEVQKKEIEIELNASAPGLDIKTINKELLEKEADLQDIERGILDIRGEKERIRTAIENSEDEKELAQFDNEITALKTELSMLETKLKGEEGIILQERLNAIKTTKGQLSTELKELSGNIKELEKRVKQNKKLLAEKEEKIKDASRALEALYAELKQIQGQIDGIHVERGKIERKVERLKEDLIRSETLKEGVEKSLSDLKYEADFYKDVTPIDAKRDELEKRANEIELELQSLGSVNMKAPEIYEEKLKDYNEIKEKVSILTHEREAVLKMIEEVETRKKEVFLKAFTAINNHFKDLAGGVFSNEVTLKLENEIDPFDGGLDIIMKVGKKERNVELMSGGEKSLLTILFVFSIHMYKPSHFYILDEVEAALDKENSKKFSELIKQISKTTQFIVVSHNDTVIVAADTALGVTKTKNGSRIVSIKLTAN